MRELKFRAWDTSQGGVMEYCGLERAGSYHEPMGHEIMQSTGLKDKNGKEIFEGDYIQWEDYRGLVKFEANKLEHYAPAFYIQLENVHEDSERYSLGRHDKNYKLQRYFMSDPPVVEVIGNAFQHPELLTPAKGE